MNYFFSKKAIPNYGVWAITILSSYVMKISDLGTTKELVYYLILEGCLWFFLGVVLTASIQFWLEKFTIKIKFRYLILFMFLASIVFNVVFWPIIDVLYEYFANKKSYHGKFATRIFNWLNWMIWFVCYMAFNFYEEVKKTKIENLELETTLKESQLNILKGQINPHFMFNSLNNIRGLMLEDVDKARNMITSLSETLRYSFMQNTIDSIALDDELEMVTKYIDLSKIQFEDRLQFESNIDKESLSIQIPPMLIQMLVENAIKHGISNLKKGGLVKIFTKVENKKLWIKVTNSGSLKQNEKTTQVGLQNIKKRLDLLYNKKAFFYLKEEENKVIATIQIPLL